MWWTEVWVALQQEFSDLADPADITRVCIRLLVALILGAALGYEREATGAAAGLRTHMLVALGSALFMVIPYQAGMRIEDMSRVMQGLTSGIGFLGAGAILKHKNQDVRGLTTAASLWLTAAVGVAAGMGLEGTALLSAALGWVVLALLKQSKRQAQS